MTSNVRHPGIRPEAREYDPLYDPVYYAVRSLIGFCQGLFKSVPDGRYRWTPDIENTEITITGAYPLTLETVNARPAIVVVHGQTQYLNTSMGSFETFLDEWNSDDFR